MHYSIFLLLTITIPSFAAFSGCDRTFSCGPIKNITYPFTGGDRPTYCGPPEFQLTCPDNTTYPDLLTNSSLTYRVLQLDQTRQTLKLARLDLYNNTCPKEFGNSTLNTTIFTNGPDNVELTLIYGCPLPPLFPLLNNMFSCNVNGLSFNNAYYFIGSDPVRNIIVCSVSVTVSVIRVVGDALSSNTRNLVELLSGGFNVNYRDVYTRHCSDCTLSGGLCGFDSNTSRPICICGDSLCVGTGKSSSSPKTLGIVLSVVGAVVAGVCAGWLIFFFGQRRKKRIAATSSTQTLSKDLPPSHSSTSLLTSPATHFSQTTPSYQTSVSDVEKGSTYFGVQVFSYTELVQATNNFDPSKELGDGGFGTVYYGTLQDGRVVAVKRLYENNFKRVEQFMNEVEILTRLDHENLVKLYGCTSKRSRELLLVYEYIPNGTVADHLHGKRANAGLLSWSVRLKIAVETAEALAYLHASDIIHRDVKTNNILLDNSFRVKVADFGLSRLFPNASTHVSTMPQGTPGYVDPEYYRCYKLTDKSDVYSFGVVLAELLSSLQAVDTDRHQKDINLASLAISKIQSQSFCELVDQSLGFETNACIKKTTIMVGELAFRCLQEDKDLRPSMKEVLGILKGIQNEELDVQTVGVLDIVVDDGAPLKGTDPLRSPDSVTDRWVSGSTQNSTD